MIGCQSGANGLHLFFSECRYLFESKRWRSGPLAEGTDLCNLFRPSPSILARPDKPGFTGVFAVVIDGKSHLIPPHTQQSGANSGANF
jgi:hypothetical protein